MGPGTHGLDVVWRPLFVWDRGVLMLADTVLPKPFATAIANLAGVYSRQAHTPVYGLSRILLVWTHGILRLPRGLRLWYQGGPSTSALALAWLSYARHRRRCRPDDVLFDAWYPSTALLKRIRDDGWDVVGRLQKHRRVNGAVVRAYRRPPYGSATSRLPGDLKVLVVRDGAKDYATHRLTWSAAEGRRLSRVRPQSEEVSRVGQGPCSLSGCQARAERAQRHPLTGGLAACCVLARERHDRGLSMYKLRRALRCHGQSITLPALERLRRTA